MRSTIQALLVMLAAGAIFAEQAQAAVIVCSFCALAYAMTATVGKYDR